MSGKLVVDYKLKNLSGGSKKQAIILFVLSDVIDEQALTVSGLQHSSVGYYRYLNTEGKQLSGTISISLPGEVSLVGLEVMKWGDENICIDKIDLYQSS